MIPIVIQGIATIGLCASLVLGSMGISNINQTQMVQERVIYRDSGLVEGMPYILQVTGEKQPQKIKIEITKKGETIKITYDREGGNTLTELDKKYLQQILGNIKDTKKNPIPAMVKKFFKVVSSTIKVMNKQIKKSW